MIVVSACLAGIPCRYDGKDSTDPEIAELAARGMAFCVCPECLGGLGFRRLPSEIQGGDGEKVLAGHARVISVTGEDVTASFVSGAHKAWELAKAQGATKAILKAGSPSCGYGTIYDGTFCGVKTAGNGVFAALLKKNGFSVEIR